MACGCGKPKCNGSIESNVGCCGNVSKATPLSSCGTVTGACSEDHCQTIINQQFLASLKVLNSWNVPDCGGAASLSVIGLKAIAIGSNLWAEQYGYFEVIGFNADTQIITVQNNCIDGNAPAGTNIPACSEFTVTDPPLADGGGGQPSLFPYVAVDFTAPNIDTCLLITVTTVNGLVVGKNVQIGSGIYRIESIPDGTHITICNDGDGITPGTAVIAKNPANQFQYPIILIDANPCTNDEVTTGCLVVCNNNIMSPLGNVADGLPLAGSIPMVQEDGSCEVAFEFLNIPTRTCTVLLCCLTLVSGEDTYVIRVADTSEFNVGDILQIGTRTDRFTITDIIDGTHFEATVDPVPGATIDIDTGTSVCIVDCCEILEATINELLPDPTAFVGEGAASNAGAFTIESGTPTYAGDEVSVVVANPSTVRTFRGVVNVHSALIDAQGEDANTDQLVFEHILHYGNSSPAGPVIGGDQTYFFKTDAQHPIRSVVGWSEGFTIAPGGSLTWFAKGSLSWAEEGASKLVVGIGGLSIKLVVTGSAI